jgi:hypothetical protein
MVIALTLITPLLVVMTYQWDPRRTQRQADDLVTIAVANAATADSTVALRQSAAGHAVSASTPEIQLAGRTRSAVSPLAAPAPGRLSVWYRGAAEAHGISPYVLEALHQTESSAAPDGCWPNIDGTGAVGPFQFKRAVFDRHGVDGNGDGLIDICGFVDALHSAAAYLVSLGADDDLESLAVRRALERYGTDADRVVDLARYYRWRDGALTAAAPDDH